MEKMINFDDVTKENIKEHNPNWPFNDSKTFIKYSNDMDDSYKNLEEYNPNKKPKILIVFFDTIPDMVSDKNLI